MPSKFQLLPGDILDRLEELPERVASLDGLTALEAFVKSIAQWLRTQNPIG